MFARYRAMLHLAFALACAANLLLGGCSSLLPSATQTTESQWKDYESARTAFEAIKPGITTRQELQQMGFDPFKYPNIKLLNYLEVTRAFLANDAARLSDLDPEIQACIKTRLSCQGFEINLVRSARQRVGNALLDIFNFRRQTHIQGWQFRGLIVLKNGQVVYKLEGGQPVIQEFEDKKNPLGPLQDISLPSPIRY